MITLYLTGPEIATIQKINDAALRGVGINIVGEVAWLQTRLREAVDRVQNIGAPKPLPVVGAPETEDERHQK